VTYNNIRASFRLGFLSFHFKVKGRARTKWTNIKRSMKYPLRAALKIPRRYKCHVLTTISNLFIFCPCSLVFPPRSPPVFGWQTEIRCNILIYSTLIYSTLIVEREKIIFCKLCTNYQKSPNCLTQKFKCCTVYNELPE